MQEGTKIEDRFGLPLSAASRAAADKFAEGLDLMLSQNYGADERFREAVETDEGFALAHAALAWTDMLRGAAQDAKDGVARAQSLTAGVSARERGEIEAIDLWINNKGVEALAVIREHLKEYPRDALMLRLAQRLFMNGCHGSGTPNFPDALFALCQSVAGDCGDEWAFLGSYAFAHHETGRLDESYRLARKSLDMHPANAVATHSVTHVYFERGDAVSGGDFLGAWLEGYDRRSSYNVHLSWHLALFELAMGRYGSALELYETQIRPSVMERSAASLADSASLMWRLQLYGGTPPPKPWEEVRDQAAPAIGSPGLPFRDAHAALAFAAAGDCEALGKTIDAMQSAADGGNALVGEMTLPIVQGIAAFATGDYGETVRLMERPVGELARIGGSHAQREVFEDTLLEGFIRAEQFEKAEAMLRERLNRRASVRDEFWMGRTRAGKGDAEAANDTMKNVSAGWNGADSDSPEMSNARRLAAQAG